MLWRGQVCAFLCVRVYTGGSMHTMESVYLVLLAHIAGWGRVWALCWVSLCTAEPVSIVGGLVWLSSPLAQGVGVADDQLVYPGEGLGEQHGPLEEAQVTPVLSQDKQHVGFFICRREARQGEGKLALCCTSHRRVTYLWSHSLNSIIWHTVTQKARLLRKAFWTAFIQCWKG